MEVLLYGWIRLCILFFYNLAVSNFFLVSGDANFSMNYTALTVGGFMQPSVARTVIELQGNADKGFSQRFLWCAPKPRMVRFSELQKVDMDFSASIGNF